MKLVTLGTEKCQQCDLELRNGQIDHLLRSFKCLNTATLNIGRLNFKLLILDFYYSGFDFPSQSYLVQHITFYCCFSFNF